MAEIHFGVDWGTASVKGIAAVDVSVRGENRETPLHLAVRNEENPAAMVEALLSASACPNVKNDKRKAAIDHIDKGHELRKIRTYRALKSAR